MVLANRAHDGIFPALRELEPGCHLRCDRCQCPRVIFRDNVLVVAGINGRSVDAYPGDRFKRDVSTLFCKREVKGSDLSRVTVRSTDSRKERRTRPSKRT